MTQPNKNQGTSEKDNETNTQDNALSANSEALVSIGRSRHRFIVGACTQQALASQKKHDNDFGPGPGPIC